MNEEKICFVIMPISDTQGYDAGHFDRVFDYLIKPAVIKAGFIPIRADKVQKTDLIMIGIIKQIINSNMCLCDLSSRNPNVLYELGIRQAFNLPVTLIRDSKTPRVFDIQGFRDIEYDYNLRIDKINKSIEIIFETLINTYNNRNHGVNSYVRLLGVLPSDAKSGLVTNSDANDHKVFDLESNINKFIEAKKKENMSENTIKNYLLQLRVFLKHTNKAVNIISKEDIQDYLLYKENKSKNLSKASLEAIRIVLKVFFDWLVNERIIIENPVGKIKPFTIPDNYLEPLSSIEIDKIREACRTLREKAVIELFLSTGCTLSEIALAKIKNINWTNKELKINNSKGTRVVFLSPKAIFNLKEYLDTRSDACEEIIITERKPYRKLNNRSIQRILDGVISRTDINKNISPKIFRHTFAKTLLEKGLPMNILQTLLGNKDYSKTSKTYNIKLTSDNKKKIYKTYFE